MKVQFALVMVVAATLLGACRREEPMYEPMKLGAASQAATVAK